LFIRFRCEDVSPEGAVKITEEAKAAWADYRPKTGEDDGLAGPGSIYDAAFELDWLIPWECWPTPNPFHAPVDTPDFDISRLSAKIREPIEAVAEVVQTPLEIAASSVLSTLALVAQPHVDVEKPGGGLPEFCPVSLFFLTIAESGERKTTAVGRAMEGVKEVALTAWPQYDLEMKNYYNDKLVHESEKRKIQNSKNLSPVDKKARLSALSLPQMPRTPAATVDDPTIEGLMKMFRDQRALSLGLFSTEGGSFVGGYSMSEEKIGKTLSTLSSFWDGETILAPRSGDDNSFVPIRRRRLTISLMAQPEIFRELLASKVVC
jgi:Protein of unknown function (DUF3987)